jgi:biopolymer transport protein ExbD
MGGVDVGSGRGNGRAASTELNMIPFVDLLMVTVAFLLITAVWVQSARLNATASVPGDAKEVVTPTPVERVMHVHASSGAFVVSWRQADTVVSETRIVRATTSDGEWSRSRELEAAIRSEWQRHGGHRDASDRSFDRAVLHVDDRAPFAEIVGLLDAIASTKREASDGLEVAAFQTSFAVR